MAAAVPLHRELQHNTVAVFQSSLFSGYVNFAVRIEVIQITHFSIGYSPFPGKSLLRDARIRQTQTFVCTGREVSVNDFIYPVCKCANGG